MSDLELFAIVIGGVIMILAMLVFYFAMSES